jgi:AcrR family transcriptional regulator
MAEGAPDGRERLLRAAIRHLEQHGEAELRVTDIAEEAQVAIGLIRHHFGSRDGLVATAQVRRIEGATRVDMDAARAALGTAEDIETLLGRIEALTRALLERSRSQVRLSRLAAIATAHGRPEARESIGAVFGDLLDEFAAIVREAQDRGLARIDLDPRAVATFMQAYSLGLIVHDLDPDPADDDRIVEVIATAVRSVLAPTA